MKRPRDLILASILAPAILWGTLFSLGRYIHQYHKPTQNCLPQGSFHPDEDGRPIGWNGPAGGARVLFERSTGHVPLFYLHLEPVVDRNNAVWTELPMGPGWRLIHVAAWFRTPPGSEAGKVILLGEFFGGESLLSAQDVHFQSRREQEWHLRENMWTRPMGSNRLRLSVFWEDRPGAFELAEVNIVPSYVFMEKRKHPTH